MYTNKYNWARRLSYRVMDCFPALIRLKRPLMYFRLKKLARRLETREREYREAVERHGRPPLFSAIEIETINRCNGECGFCPVNRRLDPRPAVKMTDELFTSLIEQLRALEYAGEVYLYSNNEPLLDVRIEAFAERAKTALPNALIFLSTNGLLLTPEKYTSLIRWIDVFTINNYSDDFTLSPGIKAVMELAQSNPEWWAKTNVVMRYRREIKTSRGGLAPNKQAALPDTIPVGCYFPDKQLIVRPDGKISLCCNDSLGSVTLGDASTDSLENVWYSDLRAAARLNVMNNRRAFPICRHCDTISH